MDLNTVKQLAKEFIDKYGEDKLRDWSREEFQKVCKGLEQPVRRKLTSRRYYLRNSENYKTYCRIKRKYKYQVPEEIRRQYVKRGYSEVKQMQNKLGQLCIEMNKPDSKVSDEVRECYQKLINCI